MVIEPTSICTRKRILKRESEVVMIQQLSLKQFVCLLHAVCAFTLEFLLDQWLFKRLVFWGNQRHGKAGTALLSDITSSLFWWPKRSLDKGSLSLTLPCSMLSLRGTEGVMGGLSTQISATKAERHYAINTAVFAFSLKAQWGTHVMTHLWLLMTWLQLNN